MEQEDKKKDRKEEEEAGGKKKERGRGQMEVGRKETSDEEHYDHDDGADGRMANFAQMLMGALDLEYESILSSEEQQQQQQQREKGEDDDGKERGKIRRRRGPFDRRYSKVNRRLPRR